MPEATCEWAEDSDGVWQTGCKEAFWFTDGGAPTEHKFRSCPYCGGTLTETPWKEPETDDDDH